MSNQIKKPTERLGTILVMGGLGAATLSAFASIPVLPDLGVWFQSEPVTASLFASASICAAGLAVQAQGSPGLVKRAFWHPLVMIPILVSLWSWLAPMPMMAGAGSFFGSPQLGLGGAWFLSLGVMTAGARCLLLGGLPAKTLMWFAGVIFAMTLILVGLDRLAVGGWRPYNFSDYLAFHGLYLWIIAAGWFSSSPGLRRGGFVVGAIIIFSSGNLTGSLAFVAALFSILAVRFVDPYVSDQMLRKLAAVALGTMAVLLPVGIYVSQFVDFPDFVSFDTVATFKSRALMLGTVLEAMVGEPTRLLTGYGWGGLPELLFSQIPLDQTVAIRPVAALRQEVFFWDALWLLQFHTHNELVEQILSGGLPSAALWLAYLVLIPLTAEGKNIPLAIGFSVGYVLLSSMWFQMPGGLPLMAMAVAGLTAKKGPSPRLASSRPRMISVLPAGAFLALAGAAVVAVVYGRAAAHEVGRNFTPSTALDRPLCGPDSPVLGARLAQFSQLMKTFATANIDRLRKGKILEPWRYERLDDFLCRADQLMSLGGPLSVGVRGLTLRSDFAFAPQPIGNEAFAKRIYSGWDKNVRWVLSQAPRRTDLAVPYLSWLLGRGEESRVLDITTGMLDNNREDPIGLWFSGVVLLNDVEKTTEAVQRLKRALRNGLEKIMPVETRLKANVNNL